MTDTKHETKKGASAHTRGPWKLGQPNEYLEGHTPIDSTLHGGLAQVVTKMQGEDNAKVEAQLEANARLIAASPRMLEALESIIRITEMRGDNKHRPEGLFELLRDAAGTARAAIAEAKGLAA